MYVGATPSVIDLNICIQTLATNSSWRTVNETLGRTDEFKKVFPANVLLRNMFQVHGGAKNVTKLPLYISLLLIQFIYICVLLFVRKNTQNN
jgi:hypothetical protein